jgi:hypothetical protein
MLLLSATFLQRESPELALLRHGKGRDRSPL